VFILGSSPGVVNVQIGDLNSMVLTGFEFLQDADTNDVFQMDDLDNVAGNLVLIDDVNDHDLIKVFDDALGFDSEDGDIADGDDVNDISVAANTIDLKALNDQFDFAFEALDVSEINNDLEIVIGTGTDELVIGEVGDLETVTGFGGIVFTQKTVDTEGDTFVLNVDTDELDVDGAVLDVSGSTITTVSFRGLVGEDALDDGQVLSVTDDITFSVEGDALTAVAVFGGDGNDSITGGAGDDLLRGGKGNDTLDGNFVPAIAATYTVTIPGAGTVTAAATDTLTVAGLTLTVALAPALVTEIAVGADADQIGAAFAAQTLASWRTALDTTMTTPQADSLQSVTYDVTSNKLVFTFDTSAGGATFLAAGSGVVFNTAAPSEIGGSTFAPTEAETYFIDRAESADTFVFEATATLNGADTLNNVNVDLITPANSDTLDFTAFLGAGAVVFDTQDLDLDAVLIGNGDVSVAFGKASLVVADLDLAGFTDGHKAVVLLSADVDGLVPVGVDVTNNAYQAYYVENGADLGNADVTITLVGTINSAVELTAAQAGGLI